MTSQRHRGLLVSELVLAKGEARTPPAGDSEALFVLSGEIVEHFDGAHRRCLPDTVSFRAGGVASRQVAGERAHIIVVNMERSRRREWKDLFPLLSRAQLPAPLFLGIPQRLLRELRRGDAPSAVAIEGLVLEIVAAAARGMRLDPGRVSWLGRVLQMIDERLSEPLTVDDLAAAAQVHPSTLRDAFRSFLGCPTAEYIRRRRIERATEMLLTSAASVAQIAWATGFCDQSHLVRVFKRTTGFTPSEFRRFSTS